MAVGGESEAARKWLHLAPGVLALAVRDLGYLGSLYGAEHPLSLGAGGLARPPRLVLLYQCAFPLDGGVNRVVRQVEEEGPVAVLAQEANCLVGLPIGQVLPFLASRKPRTTRLTTGIGTTW